VGLLPLLKALTINPARLLGLETGRLAKGAPADLALIDLNTPWVVDREQLRARSKNSPFDEQKVQGRVLRTMVAGRTVYQYGVPERLE
jgi:dihydroorotase